MTPRAIAPSFIRDPYLNAFNGKAGSALSKRSCAQYGAVSQLYLQTANQYVQGSPEVKLEKTLQSNTLITCEGTGRSVSLAAMSSGRGNLPTHLQHQSAISVELDCSRDSMMITASNSWTCMYVRSTQQTQVMKPSARHLWLQRGGHSCGCASLYNASNVTLCIWYIS